MGWLARETSTLDRARGANYIRLVLQARDKDLFCTGTKYIASKLGIHYSRGSAVREESGGVCSKRKCNEWPYFTIPREIAVFIADPSLDPRWQSTIAVLVDWATEMM